MRNQLHEMKSLYNPVPYLKITPNILVYEGQVIDAIDRLNEQYNAKIIAPRYAKREPVTNINHYQALLLVDNLSKILNREFQVPNSQQERWALQQGLSEISGFVSFLSDVVAGSPDDPTVKKLFGSDGIKSFEYPVLIRNPSVVVDAAEKDGFRYLIDDTKTSIINNAWFLKKWGAFRDNDPGLEQIGFPYHIIDRNYLRYLFEIKKQLITAELGVYEPNAKLKNIISLNRFLSAVKCDSPELREFYNDDSKWENEFKEIGSGLRIVLVGKKLINAQTWLPTDSHKNWGVRLVEKIGFTSQALEDKVDSIS